MPETDLHFQRGCVLVEQSRPQQAIEEFLKHLAIEPNNVSTHLMMANCFADCEDFESALKHARKATGLAPDLAWCHQTLAHLRLVSGDNKAALKSIDEALNLDPNSAESWGLKAGILLQQKKGEKALGAARQGLSIDPTNGTCSNCHTIALRSMGLRVNSKSLARQHLRDAPECATTHANVAYGYLLEGDYDKAQEHFREGLRTCPDDDWAKAGLIACLKTTHPVYKTLLWPVRLIKALPLTLRTIVFAIVIYTLHFTNYATSEGLHARIGAERLQLLAILFIVYPICVIPIADTILQASSLEVEIRSKDTRTTLFVFWSTVLCTTVASIIIANGSASQEFTWFIGHPFMILFPAMISRYAKKSRRVLPLLITTVMMVLLVFPIMGAITVFVYSWMCMIYYILLMFATQLGPITPSGQ